MPLADVPHSNPRKDLLTDLAVSCVMRIVRARGSRAVSVLRRSSGRVIALLTSEMCQNCYCSVELTLMGIPLGVGAFGKLFSSGIGRQRAAARVSRSSSETAVGLGRLVFSTVSSTRGVQSCGK